MEEEKKLPGEEKAEEAPAEKQPAAPEKKKKPSGGKNPFKSKKFRHGSLSVIFTVIFVTAIVLVNVIFNLALDRFDIKADMTEGGIFTAGEEISDFAEHSQSTVHFYFTTEKETLEKAADKVYRQSMEIAEQICAKNARFDVSYKDLLTDPAFAEKYGVSGSGSLIVECEDTGRKKVLNIASDFKRYTMSDGKSYSAAEAQNMYFYGYTVTGQLSTAEQEILSALMSVTKLNPIKIAFTSGFGEEDNAALTDLLEKNAYTVEKVDIDIAAEIPQEYDILVMNAPTLDPGNDTIEKIDKWLSNGGQYGKNLVYFAKAYPPASTPNLNAYLEEWGLNVGDGYLLQSDPNYAYVDPNSGLPFFQRAEIVEDSGFYDLIADEANKIFPTYYVRPVKRLWDEKSNYQNRSVVRTYGDKCTFMPFDSEKEMEEGQFDIIACSSKMRAEGVTPYYSRVIAAGSETLFCSDFVNASNYNSARMAAAIFNYISGNTDVSVTVTPKSFEATAFEISTAQKTGIGLTFAVIIPSVIIILGIVVWIRRRRL